MSSSDCNVLLVFVRGQLQSIASGVVLEFLLFSSLPPGTLKLNRAGNREILIMLRISR